MFVLMKRSKLVPSMMDNHTHLMINKGCQMDGIAGSGFQFAMPGVEKNGVLSLVIPGFSPHNFNSN